MKDLFKELLDKVKFEYIFQLIVLFVLSIYLLKIDQTGDNAKLIIGALIGVLGGTAIQKSNQKINK